MVYKELLAFFRRKKPAPIILKGGRKDRVVGSINVGRYLGAGWEGKAHEVKVEIKHGKRKKIVSLAEKQFKKINPFAILRNPLRQFKTMQELIKLNREKKLGLHILPTIRLRKIKRNKYSLIITRYKKVREELSFYSLKESELEEAKQIRSKDDRVLSDNGYTVFEDSWKLIEDPKTKKLRYYIADFGNVAKI